MAPAAGSKDGVCCVVLWCGVVCLVVLCCGVVWCVVLCCVPVYCSHSMTLFATLVLPRKVVAAVAAVRVGGGEGGQST